MTTEEVKLYGCKPVDNRNKICAFETGDIEGMVLIDREESKVLATKFNEDVSKEEHKKIKKRIEDEIR